jgi:hypothetical protein
LSIIVGVGGRIYVGMINKSSNDDHAEVVIRIQKNQSIDKDSCWECFQPKAFYFAHAALAKPFKTKTKANIIRQMNMVNVVLSILSLVMLLFFIKKLVTNKLWQKIIMSFWLTNPAFWGISVQATNDVAVIFLGTLAILCLHQLWNKGGSFWAIGCALSASLAPMIKGSGLGVFTLCFIGLSLFWMLRKKHGVGIFILFISSVYYFNFSHYRQSYDYSGSAFTTNLIKTGTPPMFDDGKEFWKRPGIASITSGYLKVPFISLLQTPYIVNLDSGYATHRTSYWTLMYGSFYNVYYLSHPEHWTNTTHFVQNTARALYILGILPLFLLALGFIKSIKELIFNVFRKSWSSTHWTNAMLAVLALVYFVFTLKYSYDYRDYGCVKAIFLLPAIVAAAHFINVGRRLFKPKWHRYFGVVFGILIVGQIVNVVTLAVALSKVFL